MSPKIDIREADFDAGAEIEALKARADSAGAIATFTGYVRGGAGLKSMRLEHYPEMTQREIARHVCEAGRRWPLQGVTVIHRIGPLVPGERIVFVAVASAHRAAAFAACEFIMDYLKVRAPFWKQEERDDGPHWVEAKASDDDAAARWKNS